MHLMPSRMRYWFCTTPTDDAGKGFDGLSGLVRNHLSQDPMTGDVFVFVSRARMHIKLLYWDGDGFVLYYVECEARDSNCANDVLLGNVQTSGDEDSRTGFQKVISRDARASNHPILRATEHGNFW